MRVAFYLFLFLIKSLIRNIYWLYNLLNIDGIVNVKMKFPIQFEGKGKLQFKEKSTIEPNTTIKIHKSSFAHFYGSTRLYRNCKVLVSHNSSIEFMGNTIVEENATIIVSGHWEIGDKVAITKNVMISSREKNCYGNLFIGNHSHIGNNSIIDVSGDLTIGSNVAIGPNCIIYTHDHDYKSSPEIPWKGKPIIKPVIIENGTWIGSGVTILPGVIIGQNSIVAAGAVVNKNVQPGSIVGGVPAKEIIKKI